MRHKTKAIVLGQQKYTDNKKIITLFTRSDGKKKLFITHSKSRKNKNTFFQLPQIIDIVYNEKKSSAFISLKESSISVPLDSIYSDPVKLSIAFFITDILNNVTEYQTDEKLFDFAESTIILLDKCQHPANLHLAFIVQITSFIGIKPIDNYSDTNKFFDIRTGKFTDFYNVDYSFPEQTSKILHELITKQMTAFVDISLNRNSRNTLTNNMLKYLTYHFPTMKFKAHQIIKHIFD